MISSVLIVEDNETAAHAIASNLRLKGAKVEIASTVARGLELLNREYDVVLLDLGLPDGNGITVLESLRAKGHGSKVIVMTGMEQGEETAQVWKYHVEAILPKPLKLSVLYYMLEV